MATWNKIIFPDAASPIMEQMIFFHDHTMVILTLITILVAYMMLNTLFNKYFNRFLLDGQEIETFWTIIPAFMLIFIAFPSLQILYMMDESSAPNLTIKTIGHQWYWSYEYSDFKQISFDSYMIPSEDLETNSFRLLDVDNRTIIPSNINIRMLISAADVIHSWAMPSLGIKADAMPGRINQVPMIASRSGLFFGQCSEICGANHSFMPIVIESTPPHNFIKWINKME
uniref:Cytochrome c oxidase subunit 2 n=1 Tax=Oligolophus tienmushanensis TaxID=1508515 RepID=A0A140X725_9ARAC|nr:cytochrome c oxidase subunit II [Oligolophus tienmushanensis]AIG60110.1 cytochrome c oxidase subunit II [Oligolophus tienmushanensis]